MIFIVGVLNVEICRPNITIIFTLIAVAVSFAWLGVEDPSQWQAGVALYILGCKFRRARQMYAN
jgi:predicted small integral membrane protein